MHRRVADRLEQSTALDLGRAADLAHHAAQSGDDGLAARAMVSAGRLCLRFYANDEALNLVRRGMQLVDNLPEPERVCVTIDLNDIKLAAGPLEDWEASAREYAMLAEQALDHGELGHARLGYHMSASLRWEHGQWAVAREESLQSERAVRSGSEEDHIVGMAHTAKCLAMIEHDLSKADAMLMEAQALSSRKGFSHYAIPAGLGMLRFHENKMDEAVELFKESRTLCKSAGARIDEFQANEYLAMIEFQRGNYELGEIILRDPRNNRRQIERRQRGTVRARIVGPVRICLVRHYRASRNRARRTKGCRCQAPAGLYPVKGSAARLRAGAAG